MLSLFSLFVDFAETRTQSSVETLEDPGEPGVWLSCSAPVPYDNFSADPYKFKVRVSSWQKYIFHFKYSLPATWPRGSDQIANQC